MRLINADALKEKSFEIEYADGWHKSVTEEVVSVRDIDNAPTIDAISRESTVTLNSPIIIQAEMVPVVRCKDCRHQEHCHETVAHTKEHDGFREHWSEPIEWCSRGKRKGGEDE